MAYAARRRAIRDANHSKAGHTAAPLLPGGEVLPVPAVTTDLQQARADLTEYGMCLLGDALAASQVAGLRDALDRQLEAERLLGARSPHSQVPGKLVLTNMVNKGRAFLDLVEHPLTEELGGHVLGQDFMLSSLTGHLFTGPASTPQTLHRDQGQLPATAAFPAVCNLYWLLDDFTAADGSTSVVPGSHRWPAEWQREPPDRSLTVQVEAPAGTLFAWDGRLWHGTGVSTTGKPRRNLAVFCCAPWMRQQENWGVTCLQEVIDVASPKLRARLGMRAYGTLGQMNGTKVVCEHQAGDSFNNYAIAIPEYVIGEGGSLYPVRRVGRSR